METLLNQGLQRLGGKSDQAVFELKQALEGGNPHSMIALGLLACDSFDEIDTPKKCGRGGM
jgi:predicted AAA+ superfamily ATPase